MRRIHTPPDPNPPKFLALIKEEEEKQNIQKMVYNDKIEILRSVLEILKDLKY